LASNKNIPAMTENLAPEVFEFYVTHQEEIDQNIQKFFSEQPNKLRHDADLENKGARHLIGNPLSMRFSSFTYRNPTLADMQLQTIIGKFNRHRPAELAEFPLEDKKFGWKPISKNSNFKSNSMNNLLSELKTALQPNENSAPYLEYTAAGRENYLITEPTIQIGEGDMIKLRHPSVSFRTTFHTNMMEAAKDWRVKTNTRKFDWKKKSFDVLDSPNNATFAQASKVNEKPIDKIFENRKSYSLLNVTPKNQMKKLKLPRQELSLGNPQDSKVKSSRLESETSGTQLIEDSFKIPIRDGEEGTPRTRVLHALKPVVNLKTNASEGSVGNPKTTTTKASSDNRLLMNGNSFSHLKASIRAHRGRQQPSYAH
jgi:hypothetical protein